MADVNRKASLEQWKSSLKTFTERKSTYITDESLKRGKLILEDFVRFSNPTGSVLDIGCGSGDFGRYSSFDGYVGIDPIAYHTQEFPFTMGVGEHLPFRDNTFDCVVTMATLDHCLEPERVVEESKRVLKDSGRLFVFLKVSRTSPTYKIRRAFSYLKALDFSSLFRSIGGNISLVSRHGNEPCLEYGHTRSFTEKTLPALISESLRVVKTKWHDQDAFIVAQK